MGEKKNEKNVAVVVGSGVAGVCAAESALKHSSDVHVVLVSPSSDAKHVENVNTLSRVVETFDVVERPIAWLCREHKLFEQRMTPKQASVTSVDLDDKKISLSNGESIIFNSLLWAAGAQPRQLPGSDTAPASRVVTLRDSDSVRDLASKLGSARSVGIVGNGGIALELAGALRGAHHSVLWLAKHRNIGDAFLDQDAAHFLAQRAGLISRSPEGQQHPHIIGTKRKLTGIDGNDSTAADAEDTTMHASKNASNVNEASTKQTKQAHGVPAGAVGPDWVKLLSGAISTGDPNDGSNITVELEEEAVSLRCRSADDPVIINMASGKQHQVDVCVVAAGVVPNVEPLARNAGVNVDADDGGIVVNGCMQAKGVEDRGVYVAGDACTCSWSKNWNDSPHWFQMRLWTQARILGAFAGACMVNAADEMAMGYNIELFAHTTRFLGENVILLGRYNAQGMDDVEKNRFMSYCRELDDQFVRVTTLDGKAIGAVLIGDTDLAETMENLIMNGIDISFCGAELLDPEVDIEDYWD